MEENAREATGVSIAICDCGDSVSFSMSNDEITMHKTMTAEEAKRLMQDFAEIASNLVGE